MSTVEVVVGRIGKPHGIRGEVTVDVRSDEPDKRYADGAVLMAEAPRGSAFPHRTLTVSRTRWHQGVLLATFAELTDRNLAETARGVVLRAAIAVDERPEDPEEFYDHQLVGLAVLTTDGRVVGELKEIVHGSAQDLLVIATEGREVLVPFVSALVPEVDVPGGRILVEDRPGLLSDLADED